MSPLFLIPLVYLASVLQIGLASRSQIAGAGPDLLAVLAVIWGMKSAGWHAILIAALIGLVSDLNSTAPLAVGVTIYALAADGILWWRRQIKLEHLSVQIVVVWTSITAMTLAESIAGLCLSQSVPALTIAAQRTAVVGLYSTLIAVPILLVMSWCGETQKPDLSR
jgi:cell shape-determining protein MreD